MAFRKGIQVPTAPNAQLQRDQMPQNVRGRVMPSTIALREAQIAEAAQPRRVLDRPNMVFTESQHVRGLVVDQAGRPIVGLSKATIQAHQAHTENATELCTRCGEYRPPVQMKTVIANAYNSNNPLRVCKVECLPLTYRDPSPNSKERWRPEIPAVRFDRNSGKMYNAREAGVQLRDLVTRDTYHKESEVAPELRPDHLAGEGKWSGGGRTGHVSTPATQERAREAARRLK